MSSMRISEHLTERKDERFKVAGCSRVLHKAQIVKQHEPSPSATAYCSRCMMPPVAGLSVSLVVTPLLNNVGLSMSIVPNCAKGSSFS